MQKTQGYVELQETSIENADLGFKYRICFDLGLQSWLELLLQREIVIEGLGWSGKEVCMSSL